MPSSSGFPGFPEGKLKLTPLPSLFFSELLPAIDHLGELKLTLYSLWLVGNAQGAFPIMNRETLLTDELLLEGLNTPGLTRLEALDDALERCVARGSLVQFVQPGEDDLQPSFLLNSARGRAVLASLQSGTEERPQDELDPLRIERPTIFTLYEQNIGPLTPMMADRLRDAERDYSPAWIEEAMEIAVANNVRRWRYIEAILDRWQTEGRDERKDRGDSETARPEYISKRFSDFWDS